MLGEQKQKRQKDSKKQTQTRGGSLGFAYHKTILLQTVATSCGLHSTAGMIGAELSASFRAQWLIYDAKLCQLKRCMHHLLHIEARLNSNLRICQVSRRKKVFTHRRFVLSLTVPMAKRDCCKKQTMAWCSWLDEALCKSSQNILRSSVCLGDLGHPLESYFQSRSWTTRISHVEG